MVNGVQTPRLRYPVTGMVLTVDRSRNTFTASIQAIPGFMRAMAMPFEVRQRKDLDGLVPGAVVEFVLVVDQKSSHAERIRIVRYQSVEQDPLAASRLKLLTRYRGRGSSKSAGHRGDRARFHVDRTRSAGR